MIVKLTGQALLDYCAEHSAATKNDLVRGAGYIKVNGTASYTEFYIAKAQALGTYKEPQPILDEEPKNHGAYIVNRWIDLDVTITVENIESAIATITNNAQDYKVSDWCGIPSFLTSENPDWSTIVEYLDTKENIHNDNKNAYEAICEDHRKVITDEEFFELYEGNYSTEAQYAKERVEDISEDSYLHNYINWQDVWEGEYKSECVSIKHSKGYYIFNIL